MFVLMQLHIDQLTRRACERISVVLVKVLAESFGGCEGSVLEA